MKQPLALFSVLLVLLTLGWPTYAGMSQVSGLFSEAKYQEAMESLVNGGEGTLPGEEDLWRSRLAADAGEAETLLRKSLEDLSIPKTTRAGMTLQLAQIHFARGEFEQANTLLTALLSETDLSFPGEVFLLAGLTQRTSGNLQKAREMLASVKPTDPAFGAARYYLGDISLEMGDPELAQRYFESGQKNLSLEATSRLKAGQWRALRVNGQDHEAEQLLKELQKSAPSSLALVEIGRVIQQEKDEEFARVALVASIEPDTVATSPVDNTGRYSLQVGAFSDRSLALEFKREHEKQIPELFIAEVRDSKGQFLYKLRFGSFVNPAQARTQAKKFKKSLGMDVIVVDLGSPTGSGR